MRNAYSSSMFPAVIVIVHFESREKKQKKIVAEELRVTIQCSRWIHAYICYWGKRSEKDTLCTITKYTIPILKYITKLSPFIPFHSNIDHFSLFKKRVRVAQRKFAIVLVNGRQKVVVKFQGKSRWGSVRNIVIY